MAIVTYFRSSSYNAWDWCQHQYYIIYGLGYRTPSGLKAVKGTMVHKVMEALAWKQKCIQEGKTEFNDVELGKLSLADCDDIKGITDRAFEFYKAGESHLTFTRTDYRDVHEWVRLAMTENGGIFNPLNRVVVEPEQQFDIPIDKPWAKYEFEYRGEKLQGQLHLKGSIDLIVKNDDSCYEIIDYKTGQRKDWATGEMKDLAKLQKDPQLMLYFYAASQLYPDVDTILCSIFFVRDGGGFTVMFDKSDLIKVEEMLKKRFEEVKRNEMPRLLSPNQSHWKCTRLCHFAKNKWPGTTQTMCEYIRDRIKERGLQATTDEFAHEKHHPNFYKAPGTTEE